MLMRVVKINIYTTKNNKEYNNSINPKQQELVKTIIKDIKRLPNYEEIMYFILNCNNLKLKIDKTNNIFNFSVLEQVSNNKNTFVFQDKFYGILKKFKITLLRRVYIKSY